MAGTEWEGWRVEGLKRKNCVGMTGEKMRREKFKNKTGDINGSFLLTFPIGLSLLSLFVQTLCVLVFSFCLLYY